MGIVHSLLRSLFGRNDGTSGSIAPPAPSSLTIGGCTVRVHKLLGEGGYAFVYAATRHPPTAAPGIPATSVRPEGEPVALKRFLVRDGDALTKVLQEMELHKRITPHRNIVGYLDHVRSGSNGPSRGAGAGLGGSARTSLLPNEEDRDCTGEVWLLMERAKTSLRAMVDERLATFAKERNSTARLAAPFTPQEIRQVLSDVCLALGHLHGQNPPVAHHDVKIENILLNEAGHYQLCDFGSATTFSITCKSAVQVSRGEATLDESMTMMYRPPEACDLWQGITVSTQADLWALGVILYTMLTGQMPFESNPRQILSVQYLPLPASLRDDSQYAALCDLCTQGLLVQDPAQRLTVDGLSERLRALDTSVMPEPLRLGDRVSLMTPLMG